MGRKSLTDVWNLESREQEYASEDLRSIIRDAFTFGGGASRSYLRTLWDGERWPSIKKKLMTEGSTWYVWYMDGVNRHLFNMKSQKEMMEEGDL